MWPKAAGKWAWVTFSNTELKVLMSASLLLWSTPPVSKMFPPCRIKISTWVLQFWCWSPSCEKNGIRREKAFLWTALVYLVSLFTSSEQWFFSPNLTVIFLWYLPSLEGWGAVRMCPVFHLIQVCLNQVEHTMYARPENPRSTDVDFRSTKIINSFVYIKSYFKHIETGEEFQHPQAA